MKFDEFYETVGVFGRYQKVKYLLLCFTNMLPPVMVYAWTFVAATPSFRCKTPLDDPGIANLTDLIVTWAVPSPAQCRESQKTISYGECKKCFQIENITMDDTTTVEFRACQTFVFDRTYYESTLVEEWSMVCDRVSWKSNVQMIFFAGYMVGSLVFGILADKYGRRPIMGVSFVLMFLAGIVCALAPQDFIASDTRYPLLAIGRFFVACATRGIAITGFVIGSEIVGPNKRLFAGIVIKYFFALGELLLLAIVLAIRNWRTLNAVLAIVPVPFIFFYFILPESPRWLISKHRYEDAELIFHHIAEQNKVPFNQAAYQRFIKEDKKRAAAKNRNENSFTEILRSRVMLIIAANMCYQWFVQNMIFYGISQNASSWLKNPFLSFAIGAVVELMGCLAVHLTLDRFGRKLTYITFVLLTVIVAASVAPIQLYTSENSSYQRGLMIVVNILMRFLSSGSYVIIYIYANETFPTEDRNTGMGFCSMIARVGAMLGTFSNDRLSRVWIHFPVALYGIASFLAVFLATIFPETLNKPLPQNIEDVERLGLACCFARPNSDTEEESSGDLDAGENLLQTQNMTNHVNA